MKKFVLLVGLVFGLMGCSRLMANAPAGPTCAEVADHLVSVGCYQSKKCEELAKKMIGEYAPEGGMLDAGCDAALGLGVLPVDCVLKAQSVEALEKCAADLPL